MGYNLNATHAGSKFWTVEEHQNLAKSLIRLNIKKLSNLSTNKTVLRFLSNQIQDLSNGCSNGPTNLETFFTELRIVDARVRPRAMRAILNKDFRSTIKGNGETGQGRYMKGSKKNRDYSMSSRASSMILLTRTASERSDRGTKHSNAVDQSVYTKSEGSFESSSDTNTKKSFTADRSMYTRTVGSMSSISDRKFKRASGDRSRIRRIGKGHASGSEKTLTTDSCSISSRAPSFSTEYDTEVNSASKLEEIGQVVRASEMSDYDQHYIMDSEEEQDFERFVEKFDKKYDKKRGFLKLWGCHQPVDENDNVSLDSEFDGNSQEVSDDAASFVIGTPKEKNPSGLVMRFCFCIDDDESLAGSYGGLREGEILIAEHPSSSMSESGSERTRSMHQGHGHGKAAFSVISGLFCCPTGFASFDDGEVREESKSFDQTSEEETSEEEFTTHTRASGVYETEESDPEETSEEEVTKHTRASSAYYTEDSDPDETCDEDATKASGAYDTEYTDASVSKRPRSTKGKDERLVLGDNVEVETVKEVPVVEGGNAFLIFLKNQKKKNETGASCTRSAEKTRPTKQKEHSGQTNPTVSKKKRNISTKTRATEIAVMDDANVRGTKTSKLVVDEKVDEYLENLEATDGKYATKHVSSDPIDVKSDTRKFVKETKTGMKYIFCMMPKLNARGLCKCTEDLDPAEELESNDIAVSSLRNIDYGNVIARDLSQRRRDENCYNEASVRNSREMEKVIESNAASKATAASQKKARQAAEKPITLATQEARERNIHEVEKSAENSTATKAAAVSLKKAGLQPKKPSTLGTAYRKIRSGRAPKATKDELANQAPKDVIEDTPKTSKDTIASATKDTIQSVAEEDSHSTDSVDKWTLETISSRGKPKANTLLAAYSGIRKCKDFDCDRREVVSEKQSEHSTVRDCNPRPPLPKTDPSIQRTPYGFVVPFRKVEGLQKPDEISSRSQRSVSLCSHLSRSEHMKHHHQPPPSQPQPHPHKVPIARIQMTLPHVDSAMSEDDTIREDCTLFKPVEGSTSIDVEEIHVKEGGDEDDGGYVSEKSLLDCATETRDDETGSCEVEQLDPEELPMADSAVSKAPLADVVPAYDGGRNGFAAEDIGSLQRDDSLLCYSEIERWEKLETIQDVDEETSSCSSQCTSFKKEHEASTSRRSLADDDDDDNDDDCASSSDSQEEPTSDSMVVSDPSVTISESENASSAPSSSLEESFSSTGTTDEGKDNIGCTSNMKFVKLDSRSNTDLDRVYTITGGSGSMAPSENEGIAAFSSIESSRTTDTPNSGTNNNSTKESNNVRQLAATTTRETMLDQAYSIIKTYSELSHASLDSFHSACSADADDSFSACSEFHSVHVSMVAMKMVMEAEEEHGDTVQVSLSEMEEEQDGDNDDDDDEGMQDLGASSTSSDEFFDAKSISSRVSLNQ